MTTDAQGRLWLATDSGISVIDDHAQVLMHMTTRDGLPGNEMLCMTWQDADTLWVGTDKGCASYDQGRWSAPDKSPRDMVLCIAADTRGRVYMGTYRNGLYCCKDQEVRRFHSANKPPAPQHGHGPGLRSAG